MNPRYSHQLCLLLEGFQILIYVPCLPPNASLPPPVVQRPANCLLGVPTCAPYKPQLPFPVGRSPEAFMATMLRFLLR